MTAHPPYERLRALSDESPVEEGDRTALLQHLAGCAACRERWLDEEPSRVFSLLSVEAIPEEALERLTRNLNRAIDTQDAPSRVLPLRYAVAAIAAALALAAFFGVELTRRSPVVPQVALDTASPAELSAPLGRDRSPEPGIELIHSPGTAQVLDLSVGDTQFVMIFDEALDI